MIGYKDVTVILLIVWAAAYFIFRRKFYSSKGYFFLLALMAGAGLFLDIDHFVHYYSQTYNVVNILVFAVLMVATLIPWIVFDNSFRHWHSIEIMEGSIPLFRKVFIAEILMGAYAIVYSLPYGLMALSMGADEVRLFITGGSFYPRNIFTTICVGIGYLSPIMILSFYLSLLNDNLRKFSTFLLIASLSYLFTMLPYAARDGFIFLPLTFIFLYRVFRNSIDVNIQKKIKKYSLLFGSLMLAVVLVITIDRFYSNAKSGLSSTDSLIYGTWGYFFQQPYVFDQTIQHFHDFFGFGRRFELINILLGKDNGSWDLEALTTSFGTMYSEFYSVSGWSSLLILSLFYYISFGWLIKHLRYNEFSQLLVFSIYLYYTITGLFYYKMFLLSVTELYLVLLCSSLFISNKIKVNY